MLEKIMDLVKDQVADKIGGMPEVPEEKKEAAVETTATSLVDQLKKYATPDNLSKLTSMFSGGGAGTTDSGGMAKSLESGVVSALGEKAGLDQSVAQKIASAVIPAVMSLFHKKVNDENEPGFNMETLIGSLSGKGGSSSGGVMDMLGGLLGKK